MSTYAEKIDAAVTMEELENIKGKVKSLVDLFIGGCQSSQWDDAEIIEDLLTVLTREDLEDCGFGDFIKAYFDSEEN